MNLSQKNTRIILSTFIALPVAFYYANVLSAEIYQWDRNDLRQTAMESLPFFAGFTIIWFLFCRWKLVRLIFQSIAVLSLVSLLFNDFLISSGLIAQTKIVVNVGTDLGTGFVPYIFSGFQWLYIFSPYWLLIAHWLVSQRSTCPDCPILNGFRSGQLLSKVYTGTSERTGYYTDTRIDTVHFSTHIEKTITNTRESYLEKTRHYNLTYRCRVCQKEWETSISKSSRDYS